MVRNYGIDGLWKGLLILKCISPFQLIISL